MVLEWTLGPRPEEAQASLLQDRSSLLQRQSTSQGNMGPPDILYESCDFIIHTNLQSCMSIISETLHDQSFSHIRREPQRFQATSYWVPEDQGTGVSV